MYKSSHLRWRDDLIVTEITKKDAQTKYFLVKDPISRDTFEFGEEEYFLCQSINGISTPSQILTAFRSRFELSMTEEDFDNFYNQIASLKLLEPLRGKVKPESSFLAGNSHDHLSKKSNNTNKIEGENLKLEEEKLPKRKKKGKKYIFYFLEPGTIFYYIATILTPFRLFFKLLLWGLIPGLPIAFLTIINNQTIFWNDILFSVEPISYLATYLFNVTLVGFTAKLAQGIIFSYYGGKPEKFGLILAAGFFPRFYCDRDGAWQLQRKQQLLIFGTPLIARLIYFVFGILFWYWNRGTGTKFATWALLFAHSSFLDFLLDACPLWPVDGFLFMLAYLRLPSNFLIRVYLVWEMVLNGRPLPKSFSFKEKWGILFYAPCALIFWLSTIFFISFNISRQLAESFSGIFGRATTAILACVVFILASRQLVIVLLKVFTPRSKITKPKQTPRIEEYVIETTESLHISKKNNFLVKRLIQLLFLVALCVLLAWPYPYRPGGQIQLLPPTQQQIQAPVDGKIIKVYFKGGDTKWIKTGTLIALMEASDIENDALKTDEQIKTQQAVLEKEQANLNKLLNTPRKEEVELAQKEVEVAKQQVEVVRQDIEVAKQEVEVAMRQLDSAISRAKFSFDEASRYQYLSQEGAVSRQRFEDKQKSAETERINVEESRKNLLVKQNEVQSKRNQLISSETSVQQKEANLKLVMSGAHPDDIAAARKQIEAARAELKRLEQELKYNKDQLQRTQLLMPIDGYLVTPYLDQKVGSYLEQGDTFAVTEDDRHIRAEVKVPEYNAGEFAVGAQVEVKLAAYPDVSFIGKVIAIEPTAASDSSAVSSTGDHTSTSSNDRIIRVIVDLPNIDRVLKAGLTGYAKIEGSEKPVIVAFTRPIVRYIQLEVWSWLP